MSRRPSFANLRDHAMPSSGKSAPAKSEPIPSGPPSRAERKQIVGFFTPGMSFAMHMLARRQGRSLQALMAEAFNDVLRKYGENPVGK